MVCNQKIIFMNSKLWILLGIIIVGAVAYYFLQPATAEITNFEQCIEAGNPAMESYPRQCRDSKSDRTFTEIIEEIPIQSPVEPPIEPIGEVVCEDYTFSNCPATCVPQCVSSSSGDGDFFLTDCDGGGSCVAK